MEKDWKQWNRYPKNCWIGRYGSTYRRGGRSCWVEYAPSYQAGYYFCEIHRMGINTMCVAVHGSEKLAREWCMEKIAKHEVYLDKLIIPQ